MAVPKMITSLIVAVADNNVIGKNNDLIWRLPNDMKYFKEITLNHHVISGRKNYHSIPKKFRPLEKRINMVLTKQVDFSEDGVEVFHSLEEAITFANNNNETELFIIGGGQIYKEALEKNLVNKMYITHVHQSFDGDTFFPAIDHQRWKKTTEIDYFSDEKHRYSYSFAVYEKMI